MLVFNCKSCIFHLSSIILQLLSSSACSDKGDGEDGGEGDLDGDVRMILMVVWW